MSVSNNPYVLQGEDLNLLSGLQKSAYTGDRDFIRLLEAHKSNQPLRV